MKMLSENIPMSHPQEALGSKLHTSLPSTVPTTSDTYATLTSVVTDSYDKQELNIIFDSLLQKWPDTGAFSDPNSEVCLVPHVLCSLFFSLVFFDDPCSHFVHFRCSPTVILSLSTSPARFTLARTLAPHRKDSGMSSSSPWELPWLHLTSPMRCPWSI